MTSLGRALTKRETRDVMIEMLPEQGDRLRGGDRPDTGLRQRAKTLEHTGQSAATKEQAASKRRMRRASVEAVRAASVSFERFWTWWCDYGRESKGVIAGTLSGGNGAGISDILERVASGRRHTAATAIQKRERRSALRYKSL